MTRLYHVIAIVAGRSPIRMTRSPVDHDSACNIMRKITDYSWRRKTLEEVKHEDLSAVGR